MSSKPQVILWRYTGSPMARKIEILLTMKGIPHSRVDVPTKPPRPQLSEVFGVAYRKVPVLSIGNDLYCDTLLIAEALEKYFPESDGYTTLYPMGATGVPVDRVLVESFHHYWADIRLFPHGASLVPWERVKDIQQDRLDLFGKTLDQMMANRPKMLSSLQSHMLLAEEQLKDGRNWVVNTVIPGIADATLFVFVNWFVSFKEVRQTCPFDKHFPKVNAWYIRFKAWLEDKENSGKAAYKTITPDESVEIIKSFDNTFDTSINEADARLWGLKSGNPVAVIPTDEIKSVPTIGELVGLDFKETVLKTVGKAGVPLRVHFPRIDYGLHDATNLEKSKL